MCGLQYVYNAWNQVMTVKNTSGTTLESETDDGLGHMVTDTVRSTMTDFARSIATVCNPQAQPPVA